jgi:hypothetical protein
LKSQGSCLRNMVGVEKSFPVPPCWVIDAGSHRDICICVEVWPLWLYMVV